jgi:hypothetical protein
MSGTTRRHEDVERTRTRPNRRSPAAVSRTLDPAKRKATIAELRELMEKVERRWRSSKAMRALARHSTLPTSS